MGLAPGQVGKVLILAGAVMIAAGLGFVLLGKLGLFKLPGDVEFEGKNWRVYLPITSCIVLSVVLTVVFWLIGYFRR